MNVEKLKNKARKLELKDQPVKAIEVYLEIIKGLEGKPEMDDELGLYNKVGDLYLKLHNVNAAVDMYERAVNRYTASGFPNNAIALCNKILRSAPGRTHIYLKLAQLMLTRGFVAEAKKNFVEYAQRMSDAGKLEEAFDALQQFADLSPGNEEIRAMLAEQLKSAARDDAARAEIDRMMAASAERPGGPGELADQVRQVDPEYDVDAPQRPPRRPGKSEDLVFISLDDEPDEVATQPLEPVPEPQATQPMTALPDLQATQPMEPVEEVEPLEIQTTSLADASAPPSATGDGGLEIERTTLDEVGAVPEVSRLDGLELGAGMQDHDDIPTLELTDVGGFEEAGAAGAGLDVDEEEPTVVGGELELIVPDQEPAGVGAPEPVEEPRPAVSSSADLDLDLEVPGAAPAPEFADLGRELDLIHPDEAAGLAGEPSRETVESLERRLGQNPDDAALRRELAEALLEAGDRERGLQEMDAALRTFEAQQDWSHASGVADVILRLEPNSITHHQKRVEYAYRGGEHGHLIGAYLELADALFRSGSLDNAKAIYERVIESDPGNRRASDALLTIAPPEPSATAQEAEARRSAQYVDLGQLILEDVGEKDTRMRVEQGAPSGDEQQDFQEMLRQFKRGIEENLDEEDAQAHYDLGVAFKEMGLLDEAIGEFQKALRRPDTRLQSAEMLGHCFMEKGQLEVAATVFRRAVEGDPSPDQAKIGLLYWLGRCEEERTRPAEALKVYQRVFAVDIHFSDVQRRVNALVQAGHAGS